MTGRHSATPPQSEPMRADDPVAPGIKRSRSAYLVAAGLLIIVSAVAGSIVTLATGVRDAKDSATLSSDETQQLREFLADRSKQRDAERAEVQEQLDDVTGAICAAVKTLQSAAQRPEARAVLEKAAKDLRCSALGVRPSSTPTTKATPSAAATSGAPARSTAAAASRSTETPTVRPTGATVAPRPAGTTPAPATTTAPGRLLDPVTVPVCDLLGVCL